MKQGELLLAAAQLTNAAIGGVGAGKIVITPNGQLDPSVQAENLNVWEEFRVFYHALLGIVGDQKSWPLPPDDGSGAGGGNLVQNVMTALQSAQSGSGPLIAEGQQLLAMIKQYMGGSSVPATPATLPTAPK